MQEVKITTLYPETQPAETVHVSEEFFRFPLAEANKIAVIDDDPQSLHLELFGEPAPTRYFVPIEVFESISKECDDELQAIISKLY